MRLRSRFMTSARSSYVTTPAGAKAMAELAAEGRGARGEGRGPRLAHRQGQACSACANGKGSNFFSHVCTRTVTSARIRMTRDLCLEAKHATDHMYVAQIRDGTRADKTAYTAAAGKSCAGKGKERMKHTSAARDD